MMQILTGRRLTTFDCRQLIGSASRWDREFRPEIRAAPELAVAFGVSRDPWLISAFMCVVVLSRWHPWASFRATEESR